MQRRAFGDTGFETSLLGFGAGQIGEDRQSDAEVEALLKTALDLGLNLIDTARGYGRSEERIGQLISHRREEFILSTKVGYGLEGRPDWTYDTIIAGVDEARRQLRSDVIDIVHLHSCPYGAIEEHALLDALAETVRRGWVRVPAYSGENDDLARAVGSGKIQGLQTSVNLFDQRDIDGALAEARRRGVGSIGKRTIANAPWRFDHQPVGHYCEPYWLRMQAMALESDLPMLELALRFAVFSAGVDCNIVGTSNAKHLAENVRMVEKGSLPEDVVAEIRERFQRNDDGWDGQI